MWRHNNENQIFTDSENSRKNEVFFSLQQLDNSTLRTSMGRISQSIDQRQEDGTRRRWKRSIEERRKSVVTVRSSQVERTYSRADETADATSDAVSRVGKARERIQGWKCVSVTRLVSCLGWSPCVEPAWGGEKRGGWMEGGEGGVMKTESGKNERARSDASNWAKREYETRLMQQSNFFLLDRFRPLGRKIARDIVWIGCYRKLKGNFLREERKKRENREKWG